MPSGIPSVDAGHPWQGRFWTWLSPAEEEGEEMEEEPDEPSLEEQLATVKDDLNLGQPELRSCETSCCTVTKELVQLGHNMKMQQESTRYMN